MGGKKPKTATAKKKAAAAAEKAAEKAGSSGAKAASKSNEERLTSEELGFVIRTGPDAVHRNVASLEVDACDIVIHAGKQELLFGARLKCNYGQKYGLVGRNGVGKSTLLRAIIARDGRVDIPSQMHMVVHSLKAGCRGCPGLTLTHCYSQAFA